MQRAGELEEGQFEIRTLLNVLCSAAAAGCPVSKSAGEQFGRVALARMADAEPHHLGGLLWSMGKLGLVPLEGAVFTAAAARAWQLLDSFQPNNLCNLLYGFGLTGFNPGAAGAGRVQGRGAWRGALSGGPPGALAPPVAGTAGCKVWSSLLPWW